MATISTSGLIYNILENLTAYVFGNTIITSIVIIMAFMLFALLIQIPLPFAIALNIPLIIILTAINYIPMFVGGILISLFLLLCVWAFTTGTGLN
jgi:hypothetical protein